MQTGRNAGALRAVFREHVGCMIDVRDPVTVEAGKAMRSHDGDMLDVMGRYS